MRAVILHPRVCRGIFVGGVLLYAGLIVGGIRLRNAGKVLEAELAYEHRLWRELAERPLTPSKENLAATHSHLAQTRAQVDRVEAAVAPLGEWPPPRTFAGVEELHFELLNFVEEQRAAFERAGITLEAGEAFGFGQVIRQQEIGLVGAEGSIEAARVLSRIDRQRHALAYVLGLLLEAKPEHLLGVERVPVQVFPNDDTEKADDLFVMAPLATAAVEGAIQTSGLRIRFVGKTEALRLFMGKLTRFERGIVVRSIEVQPGETPSMRRVAGVPASPFVGLGIPLRQDDESDHAIESIVESNESQFTVVLEAFELVDDSRVRPRGGAA